MLEIVCRSSNFSFLFHLNGFFFGEFLKPKYVFYIYEDYCIQIFSMENKISDVMATRRES